MAEVGATDAAKPKKHSAFAQTAFKKSGEALDLGGKALIGFSGLGPLLKAKTFADVDWIRLMVEVAFGGAFLAFGIHLQAKAEETT